jgi:hypothetical protein
LPSAQAQAQAQAQAPHQETVGGSEKKGREADGDDDEGDYGDGTANGDSGDDGAEEPPPPPPARAGGEASPPARPPAVSQRLYETILALPAASLRGLLDAVRGHPDPDDQAHGIGPITGSRFIYLWGLPASGRSHLLHALVSASTQTSTTHRARLLTPASGMADFEHDPSISLWLVDDCDRLDLSRQVSVFHLFNAIQAEAGAALVSAGATAPAARSQCLSAHRGSHWPWARASTAAA